MPDRKLTEKELIKFIEEHKTGVPFKALKTHANEGGEPSIYDLCIIELCGILEALTEQLINLGLEVKELNERLTLLELK